MRALAAILLLVGLALSGCSSGGDDDPEPSTSSSSTTTATTTTSASFSSTSSSSSTTSAPPPPQNRAPTGSIAAAINGTTVNFTLSGSDADGDALSWTLDFGDGNATQGTLLLATVNHTYLNGNYTANFTVTDGKASVSYELLVPVAGSTAIVLTAKQAVPSNPASSATVPTPFGSVFAGATACAGFAASQNGQGCVWFEIGAALVGRSFTITADAGDPDYEFWPACTPADPEGQAFAGSTAEGPEAGVIPEGTGCVVIWAKLPPDAPTHTFTAV